LNGQISRRNRTQLLVEGRRKLVSLQRPCGIFNRAMIYLWLARKRGKRSGWRFFWISNNSGKGKKKRKKGHGNLNTPISQKAKFVSTANSLRLRTGRIYRYPWGIKKGGRSLQKKANLVSTSLHPVDPNERRKEKGGNSMICMTGKGTDRGQVKTRQLRGEQRHVLEKKMNSVSAGDLSPRVGRGNYGKGSVR